MTNKKKIILSLLVLSIVVALVLINQMTMENIPSNLRYSKNVDANRTVINENEGIAVYFFPIFDDEILNTKINELMVEIQSDFPIHEYEEIKVDYDCRVLPDQSVSFLYTVESSLLEKKAYYSFFLSSEKELGEVASDEFLSKLSDELRYHLQSNYNSSDEMFTVEFYENTSAIKENFEVFNIDEENINFYFNENEFNTHESFILSYPLKDISDSLLIDTGVKQTKEDALIEIPQRYVDPNRKMIALTFDDGPRKKVTEDIIYYLDEMGQNATFFMLGSRIKGNEWIVLDMINAGNDAATHSYSHTNLNKLSSEELEFELEEPANLIYELSNKEYEVNLHRPPYGASNDEVKLQSNYPFILWNIDSLDWKNKDDPSSAIDIILEQASDGDIILLHDLYSMSIEIAETIILELIERGFQIVSVSQMAEARGVELEAGKAYRSFQ